MKTSLNTRQNYFLMFYKQLNHLHQWKKLNDWYSRCSSWLRLLSAHVQTLWTTSGTLDVHRIYRAGLDALKRNRLLLEVSIKEAWNNKRFRAGLILGLVAFPAWKSHIFFDINERDYDFYYVNYAFYFNTIRAYLAGIFLAIGFFIAAPQKWKFKWWALPVVVFCATEIYAESYYTDWTDFYQPMPAWQVSVILLFCMPALFFSMDYLLYRKYHLKDGNLARINGIIQTPGIPWEKKGEYLEKLIDERQRFNERV